MKKLKLELDDIRVDSFELGKEGGRGTVRANCACCNCCPCCCTCCCTCDPSCGGTCYDSCGGTCDVSCGTAGGECVNTAHPDACPTRQGYPGC